VLVKVDRFLESGAVGRVPVEHLLWPEYRRSCISFAHLRRHLACSLPRLPRERSVTDKSAPALRGMVNSKTHLSSTRNQEPRTTSEITKYGNLTD
jgi:hypothetical protein